MSCRKNENAGWIISAPHESEATCITRIHQRAFVDGYRNDKEPEMGANTDALEGFVQGEFANRKLAYWRRVVHRRVGIYAARLDSGKIVGFAESTEGAQPEEILLSALYVEPAYQRHGAGSALLQAVMADMAPAKKVIRLEVTRWAYAVSFYKKRGFWPTDRMVSAPEPPKAYGITLEQIEMQWRMQRSGLS